jgi:hypothetical protein
MEMQTGRLTADLAMLAVDLYDDLHHHAHADGVLTPCEQRILRKARQVKRRADKTDAALGVLLSGFRERGIDSPQFRRRLREYDQDAQSRIAPKSRKAA